MKINGNWRNWFTCRKDFDECPLCDDGQTASYVCAYTVIDHSKFTDKQGRERKNEKKLLIVKSTVMPKIARRRQALDGDLTYACLQFHRDKADEGQHRGKTSSSSRSSPARKS